MAVQGETENRDPNAPRGRVVRSLIALSLAAIATVLVWQFLLGQIVPMAVPSLSPERSEVVARRVGVAFDDAERSWSQFFAQRGEADPGPAEMVLFNRSQPSPCSGATPATGPFYCPVDNVAGFDLAFLDSLESAMYREGELGTAIVVARIVASHVQDSVAGRMPGNGFDGNINRERVLQADCLAGVWAGMAETRLGTVPPGFYARLVAAAQDVSKSNAKSGLAMQPSLDPFHLADSAARETAFQHGRETINPDSCREVN